VGGTTLDLRIAGIDIAVLDAGGFTFADNVGVSFGTGDDASILWDATDLVYDVDSGAHNFTVATTSIATIDASGVTLQSGGDGFHGAASTSARMSVAVAQEDIADGVGGAIDPDVPFTSIEADAGGDAFTMAGGSQVGQTKEILFTATAGGTGVVTIATLDGGNTITFTAAGAYAKLQWDGTSWFATHLYNQATGVITDPVVSTV
jgi:hypothetical protein